MKKSILFIALALVIGMPGLNSLMAQGKIGHLNSDDLILAMPETDSINKVLSDLSDEYQRLGEDLQVKYNQTYEAYTTQAETLKPMEKKLKETELMDMQKRIQTFTNESQQDYQKRQQELFQPVLLRAQNAITETGKENGFLYIIDTAKGVLLYIPEDESLNVLPLVKKKLGIKEV